MPGGPLKTVVVTDQNQKWIEIPDATVVTARRYVAEPESGNAGTVRLLNLCRTGRYQGRGYYVSLLAEARGHSAVPNVKTIENLRSEAYVQALDAEIQPLVQETLHHDDSERFQLDVYLGRHPGHRSEERRVGKVCSWPLGVECGGVALGTAPAGSVGRQ